MTKIEIGQIYEAHGYEVGARFDQTATLSQARKFAMAWVSENRGTR